MGSTGWSSPSSAGDLTLGCKNRRPDTLSNSATTLAKIQGLSLRTTESISSANGWVVQRCRNSITKSSNRITRRRPDEGSRLMVSQKPEISNQTTDSFQWMFANKDVWTEWYTVWHAVTYYSFHDKVFSMLFCLIICVNFLFVLWGRLHIFQRADMREW